MPASQPHSAVEASEPASEHELATSAVRKASWHLLPLLAVGYGVAFMDRANISFAALEMNRDLHFSATTYGLGAGLFFLSYALCEIPSNLLLLRYGARRWLARIMFTWGVLAIGMMWVRTPLQFYVVRFLLGMAEAGFFPGVIFYLMQWFPPNMRARAVSRFYCSLPLSSVVMGALAGSLLNLQGRLGLAGWQWLFLVEGLPALILSAIFLRSLPDTPADAAWLTMAEAAWLAGQVGADASVHHAPGSRSTHSRQALASLGDSRVWVLGLLMLCMLTCTYGFAFSAPAILKGLTGWTTSRVGFLIAAINVAGAAAMLLNAEHSDRSRERVRHVVLPFVAMAACFLLGGASSLPWLAVPSLAAVVILNSALQGPLLATPSLFLKGSQAAAGFAAMNMIAMLGGFIGPYWMGLARDLTGNYQRGLLTLAVPSMAAGMILFGMRNRLKQTPGQPQ